jgi:hypothetical protein
MFLQGGRALKSSLARELRTRERRWTVIRTISGSKFIRTEPDYGNSS